MSRAIVVVVVVVNGIMEVILGSSPHNISYLQNC